MGGKVTKYKMKKKVNYHVTFLLISFVIISEDHRYIAIKCINNVLDYFMYSRQYCMMKIYPFHCGLIIVCDTSSINLALDSFTATFISASI